MRTTVETVATSNRRQEFAEVLLDGRDIESAADLLRSRNGELLTCDGQETSTFELFFEFLALGFGAFEQGVSMAEFVGQRFVR